MSNDGIKFNLNLEVSKDTLRDLITEVKPKNDNTLYGILYKWILDFFAEQATQYVASKNPDMYGSLLRYTDYFNEDGTMKVDKVFKLYSGFVSPVKVEAKSEAKEEEAKEEETKEEEAKEEEAKEEEAKEKSADPPSQNLLADFVKLWSTCATTGTVEPSEVIGLVSRTTEYLNNADDGKTPEQILEETLGKMNEDNTPPFDN